MVLSGEFGGLTIGACGKSRGLQVRWERTFSSHCICIVFLKMIEGRIR
jgi:hypothetical protein